MSKTALLFAGLAIPAEAAARLSSDLARAVRLDATRAKLIEFGIEPVGSNAEEFAAFLRDAVSYIPHVSVRTFDCLLIDLAEELDAHVVVKGLRAVSDFEREFQMAQLNHRLDTRVETMFIMAIPEYTYLSSSAVKEIAAHDGDVRGLVPDPVADVLAARLKAR